MLLGNEHLVNARRISIHSRLFWSGNHAFHALNTAYFWVPDEIPGPYVTNGGFAAVAHLDLRIVGKTSTTITLADQLAIARRGGISKEPFQRHVLVTKVFIQVAIRLQELRWILATFNFHRISDEFHVAAY